MADKNNTIERADALADKLAKEKKLTPEVLKDINAARYGNPKRAEKILKKYDTGQS